MNRSGNRLFAKPRRRRWPWLLLVLPILAAPLPALLQFSAPLPTPGGLGQPLVWQSAGQLPDWARAILTKRISDPDSQILVAIADLNRDRQPELLVAPAMAQYDVFVPDSRLRILQKQDSDWILSAADLSCRPARLGSFITNGYWDLPCRTGRHPAALRWAGSHYAVTGRPAVSDRL